MKREEIKYIQYPRVLKNLERSRKAEKAVDEDSKKMRGCDACTQGNLLLNRKSISFLGEVVYKSGGRFATGGASLELHGPRVFYLVSSRRKVIRSFLSLAFFRPPKAIFVPGMYFLGFSRYSN